MRKWMNERINTCKSEWTLHASQPGPFGLKSPGCDSAGLDRLEVAHLGKGLGTASYGDFEDDGPTLQRVGILAAFLNGALGGHMNES